MAHDPVAALEAACAPETPADLPRLSPQARIRAELLELARAPHLPLDFEAYDWRELFPGIRFATTRVEGETGLVVGILWGKPGARYPSHRHLGDESVLVLQGIYRDESGDYRPGEVARRREGSVHAVEVPPGDDCISYVVSYGGHEFL